MKQKAIEALMANGRTKQGAEKEFAEVVAHILRGEYDYSAGAISYATKCAAEDILDSFGLLEDEE